RYVAIHMSDGSSGSDDIWIFDTTTGGGMPLLRNPASESDAVWSPDDRHVMFSQDGLAFLQGTVGTDQPIRPLFRSAAGEIYPNDWSRDGRWLVYSDFSNSWADLWLLSLSDASPRAIPFRRTPSGEHQARFSPDSRWVAYTSEESGRPEVYAQGMPPNNQRLLVSSGGGTQPMWSGDGRELYYLAANGAILATPFDDQTSTPVVGRPQVLFYAPSNGGDFIGVRNHYAVTGDGQRFLVRRPLRGGSWAFTVISNWTNRSR
ncbi:MAG: hypothetical protein AB7I50_14905, partial [Vicinamibacterales bacterium]